MSKELIEQLAKLIYQQWALSPNYVRWVEGGNSLNQDKARRIAKQFIDDNQAAAPIDNVAVNKSECAAVMPNGKTCTNVYEAYFLGVDEGLSLAEKVCDDVKPILAGNFYRGQREQSDKCAKAIRALIPDTQANRTEG
jgi:hypothetical protein